MPRIRITCDGWEIFHHPVEPRVLQEGDEFEVDHINDDGIIIYMGSNGVQCYVSRTSYIIVEEAAPTTCTCDIVALMGKGCQCGAFQAEQA